MNSLLITNGKIEVDIWIEDLKFIYSEDYRNFYNIKKILKQYFSKKSLSDNQIENEEICSVKINDNKLMLKDYDLFEISSFFDLTTDLKMQSKSLLLRYFESKFYSSEISDELNTINILLDSLSNDLHDENVEINPILQLLTEKTIAKLLSPSLIIDETNANEYDFDYDRLIIFQIKLLQTITQSDHFLRSIIICDLPYVSSEIIRELEKIRKSYILVLSSNPLSDSTNINYSFLKRNKYFEISNDVFVKEQIYDKLSQHLELEEVYSELKNIIENKSTIKTKLVKEIVT